MKITVRIEYLENYLKNCNREFSTVEVKTFKGRWQQFWHNLTYFFLYKRAHERLMTKLKVLRNLHDSTVILEDHDLEYLGKRWRQK